MMMTCWQATPASRPSFSDLMALLTAIVTPSLSSSCSQPPQMSVNKLILTREKVPKHMLEQHDTAKDVKGDDNEDDEDEYRL